MLHVDAVVDWTKSEFVALTRNTTVVPLKPQSRPNFGIQFWKSLFFPPLLSALLFYVDLLRLCCCCCTWAYCQRNTRQHPYYFLLELMRLTLPANMLSPKSRCTFFPLFPWKEPFVLFQIMETTDLVELDPLDLERWNSCSGSEIRHCWIVSRSKSLIVIIKAAHITQ